MAVSAYLPTLGTVVTTALVDSINPCAIGVLILLASIMVVYKSKRELLFYGLVYIFFVFLTYLLAGLGILYFLSSIPLYVSEYISIFVGTLIIVAGWIEIKDFFWYGHGITLAIPPEKAKQIHELTKKVTLLLWCSWERLLQELNCHAQAGLTWQSWCFFRKTLILRQFYG